MLVVVAVLLVGICGSTAAPEDANGVLRSRVYKFKHITSGQAQEMLSQLQIGQGFDRLNDEALIITSNSSADLVRATEVVTVLDQAEPVEIVVLGVADSSQTLPSPDDLVDRLETVIAGTLSDAPPKGSANPGIIDMLGDQLIAIGTKPVVTEIQQTLQVWQEENPAPAAAEEVVEPEIPAEPTEAEEPTVQEVVPEPVIETQEPQPEEPAVEKPEAAAADADIEEPAVEAEAQAAVDAETPETTEAEKTLEEIAAELFAQPEETVVVEEAAVEPEDEVPAAPVEPQMTVTEDILIEERSMDTDATDENDFMGDELLRTLEAEAAAKSEQLAARQAAVEAAKAAAEQKAAEEAARIAAEKAAAEQAAKAAAEPQPETISAAAQQRAEAIAAMQQQAAAEAQVAEAAKEQGNDELRKAIEALLKPEEPQAAVEETQIQEPVEVTTPADSGQDQLLQEMALLRQQIAELKAAKQTPAEQPQTLTAPSKLSAKRTKTEFEEAIADEMLETIVDLPQEVELESLVDLVGKQLGLDYLYDPGIFKSKPKVTLKIHGGKIKVKDLYSLLESVLRSKDFVMTRRGRLVTIMDKGGAAKVNPDPVFRGPDDPIQPGDIIVSTVFQLKHIDANTAKNTLASMKLATLTNGLQVVAETNTLIVTDYAYRMDRIGEALDMIDVAGDAKEFEYRQLKYMQAASLVEKLKKLIAEMEGVSLQVSSTPSTPVKTRPVRTRDPKTGRTVTKQVPVDTAKSAGGSTAAKKGGVYIDVDERTNRILMIGKRSDLDTLNQLIDTLDVPQQDLKFVREYVIQHVEAVEVVNVMNELGLASVKVTSTQTATPATTRTTARAQQAKAATPARAATTSAAKSGGDEPNISIRPATNSLLVNATAEQHQAIELVIAHVDVVQKDQRTIREYEIQHVDTQEIIETMTDLGMISSQSAGGGSASRTTSSRTSRTSTNRSTPSTATKETAAPATLAGIGGEGQGDITAAEPQISILEATNSLLVYATPRQHKAISLLIAHADRVPERPTTPYVVYALENQEPGTLAETLEQIVSARETDTTQKTSSAASKVQTKTPAASASTSNIPNQEEESIRIIPDEDSYSLIVYANKRNQQWIGELIRELDEYRPQVLLDCTLVEISENNAFEYDFDIVSKTYGGSAIQDGSPIGTLNKSSFSSRSLADASSLSGSFTGFFNSEMIQVLLETVESKGYGRVMARPKILVNDNQEGEIKTENTTSVAQVSTTTSTTTSDLVTNTDVSFNDYQEGVTLNILPHISKGEMLRLEITLNRTDFTLKDDVKITNSEGIEETYPSPPDRLSTDVTTVATVPDGTTIILGGLEDADQQKSQTKVPLLGDLPIIGGLFRSVNNLGDQGRLYVFVKANIIRPGNQIEGLEDIKRVSAKYRAEFEEMEEEFQTLQDWPGIDPEPMDPVRVLEDDFEDESL